MKANKRNKFTVIRGLPGSGKSTYAKEHYPNTFLVENDMYCIHNGEYVFDPRSVNRKEFWVWCMIREALRSGMDVVTACTYGHAKKIRKLKELADTFGAEFEVIRLTASYGSIHEVPESVLKDMRESFEDWPGETIINTQDNVIDTGAEME